MNYSNDADNDVSDIKFSSDSKQMVSRLGKYKETTIMNQYLEANKALSELNTMKAMALKMER